MTTSPATPHASALDDSASPALKLTEPNCPAAGAMVDPSVEDQKPFTTRASASHRAVAVSSGTTCALSRSKSSSMVTGGADDGALMVPLRRANHARVAKSKRGAPVDSIGASTGAAVAADDDAKAEVAGAADAEAFAAVVDWFRITPVDAAGAALDWASTAATSVMAIGSTMQG